MEQHQVDYGYMMTLCNASSWGLDVSSIQNQGVQAEYELIRVQDPNVIAINSPWGMEYGCVSKHCTIEKPIAVV
jgi:outer membrane lipopolysaccharide assembly protein LptE/RlpB